MGGRRLRGGKNDDIVGNSRVHLDTLTAVSLLNVMLRNAGTFQRVQSFGSNLVHRL